MAEPKLDTYKPFVPYPLALNRPKAKVNESDDHLLEAIQKRTIIIPLIDATKHISTYVKFLKGISTPHRNLKRIQLRKRVSLIMMNYLPIKKRDPGAPMITSEIRGMTFTRSLLDTKNSINILPKAIFGHHHVGELQPFFVEICLAGGSEKKTSWYSRGHNIKDRTLLFPGRFPIHRHEYDLGAYSSPDHPWMTTLSY